MDITNSDEVLSPAVAKVPPEDDGGPHFCTRCASEGPFASPRALLCMDCTNLAAETRRAQVREYHQARYRAVAKLIDAHRQQFAALFDTELARQKQGLVGPKKSKANNGKA